MNLHKATVTCFQAGAGAGGGAGAGVNGASSGALPATGSAAVSGPPVSLCPSESFSVCLSVCPCVSVLCSLHFYVIQFTDFFAPPLYEE